MPTGNESSASLAPSDKETQALPAGAGNRARTGTGAASHGILSPGRLPIPPLRRNLPIQNNSVNTILQQTDESCNIYSIQHKRIPVKCYLKK